ncbi:MAG: CapA family protein [Anaerolineales bacterium]|nr:CapA family protein [Anaerolineales bacterium]
MQPPRLLTLTFLIIFLTACGSSLWGTPGPLTYAPTVMLVAPPGSTETATPFQPLGVTPPSTPTLPPTATLPLEIPPGPPPVTASLWISPAVPAALRQSALASGFPLASAPENATVLLDINLQSSIENRQSVWIYALVAPFSTVTDGVRADELRRAWAGEPAGPFAGRPLWMTESTLAAFSAKWGAPGPGSVRTAPADQLLDAAWGEQPAWGIIPFESLEPRWKVLTIDGQSPIHKDFDLATYPLFVTFSLHPSSFILHPSNRDPSKLTTLVMTGVTALVRATAFRMEQKGVTYPARDIGDLLRSADLTHISNEVPFAAGCPYPDPNQTTLRFCSDPRYIELMEYIGTDIVELTGNHFQDYGSAATLYTLELYKQRGWQYYGGGADLQDASQAITLEHNGNRLAFIGCNPVGPPGAWATETRPGAASCDYYWMHIEIARRRAEGYLPIVTFQYFEYYTPIPTDKQKSDFRGMAEAGALIVNGSQAHLPQAMEFYSGAFIHYGLGNLFFDQMDIPVVGTRREFIDRHTFYAGKYISTELLTAMLEDYARPRPMTSSERIQFLQDIFSASGW